MTSSRIFTAFRSGWNATGTLPSFHNTNPATRYQVIRTSTYFSNTKENSRIWFGSHTTGSWQFTALLTAAATAVTVGITSLIVLQQQQHALTLCEQQQCRVDHGDDDDDDEDFHDPMSSYALAAIIKEMKIQHDQQQRMEESSGETKELKSDSCAIATAKTATASVQATSSSMNDPFPLNPSEAFPDGSQPILSEAEAKIEEATRKAKQHSGGLKIFSGNGNMSLALEICRHLGVNLGKATVGRFADGEVNVVIHENVRGKDVYIVQPTCPPVNDNIMELLLMVSTLRRSSARRITVVIPYYGYARQDRKMQVRCSIFGWNRYCRFLAFPSSQILFPFLEIVNQRLGSQLVLPMWHALWNRWGLIVSLRWICIVVKSKVSLVHVYQ
jgi:N-terminal domain of ribose phosphate pyrophosphokinase